MTKKNKNKKPDLGQGTPNTNQQQQAQGQSNPPPQRSQEGSQQQQGPRNPQQKGQRNQQQGPQNPRQQAPSGQPWQGAPSGQPWQGAPSGQPWPGAQSSQQGASAGEPRQQGPPRQQASGQPRQKPQQTTPGNNHQQPLSSDTERKITQVTGAMSRVNLSPTKSLALIESAPDGKVYEGTRGKKCILEVNYLQLLIQKLIPKAFHYDVEFDPPTPKKLLSPALDEFMKSFFKNVHFAFDGRKNVYTNQLLKVNNVVLDGEFVQEVKAVLNDRSRDFKVKIKFATEVDMSVLKTYKDPQYQKNDKPSQAIQCLDVILRNAFKSLTATNRAVAAGRALYFPQQKKLDLTEGMELWLGLFQSAILGRQSLYLNVDVAHKAFPSAIPILEVLKSFTRDNRVPDSLDGRMKEQLNAYLKMLSIGYRPDRNAPMKTFGYNGLVQSANEALFVDDSGQKMSVQQYFQNVKNIRLQFPYLPCIWVGSRVRNVYLPLELCEIPAGQATNKKCTPNAVAQMIRYSATSTEERKRKIMDLLNKINYASPEVQGFGIGVDSKFQRVEGRVIDPPKLKYIDGMVTPQRGVWNGRKFLETQPEATIPWAIINCDDRTSIQKIIQLKGNILTAARQQGVKLADSSGNNDCFSLNMMRARPGDMERQLDQCLKRGYKIVFVVIIDRNDCYAQVKQAAELKVGILTQCIKSNTVFRMERNPMMTVNNILLKVNAKLNGKNLEVVEPSYQRFNSLNDGVMFVGADVTHPSPDQRDIPSVVGVACSYDQVGFKYQCAWRLQDPKKEMIEDLENILTEHLKFYKQKNGKLPGKIMYYRDGVSEGQFTAVLDIEMTAIRNALKKIYGNSPAKVTFIVVQKRHHTRFFPTQKEFCDGKNNNIPAGTVVDKDIVHPFQYQFFLASHAAIQGVTKPSKYCVLVNESNIHPDELQAITYDLCHLFTRCNRSVSYPAPTYYAHLVAARGKQYTIGARLNMKNLQREYTTRLIHNNIVNNAPMFFV